MTDMTVTNGAWEYLLITDIALVTVEWMSSEEDRQAMMRGAGGALASLDYGLGSTSGGLGLDGAHRIPSLFDIEEMHYCTAGNAPPELKGHRSWPRVEDHRPVVVMPRLLVDGVSLRWWGSFSITFNREIPRRTGGINFWQVARARGHLRKAEYPLR